MEGVPNMPKMPKPKVARRSTKGVGKGYGKNPLRSPKAGEPGHCDMGGVGDICP